MLDAHPNLEIDLRQARGIVVFFAVDLKMLRRF